MAFVKSGWLLQQNFQPPEGKQRDCSLQIVCWDGKIINLCAESADDYSNFLNLSSSYKRYCKSEGDLALDMLAEAVTRMALGLLFWVF
uniref:Uncharacterized protein n=1 Tax=Meleagris gallopavo TaxID=9103 RepID=A0A803YFN9_MELGA